MQFELEQATEILASTPAVLDALLRGKSAAWLNARKAPNAFRPVDVLGHLIHAEHTDWIPRVRLILAHGDSRAFEPFDRFGFHHLTANKPVGELLDQFAVSRRECLQALTDLGIGDTELALNGMHPEQGRVTMRELLADMLPGVRYEPPQAGYLAWLDCTALELDAQPVDVFLTRGRVALSRGRDFGDSGAACVRLNFGTTPAILTEVVERMRRSLS